MKTLTRMVTGVMTMTMLACGAAPESDEQANTGETFEELGEASCATATANTTVTGRVNHFITSIEYSNPKCVNAWVLDINSYNFSRSWTSVGWYDPLNTAAECNKAIVQAQLYVKSGASWVKQGGLKTSQGSWLTGPLSFCQMPEVTWFSGTDLVLGKSYRITANGHYSGSIRTRAVLINSGTSVVH